jgi:NTP pyrophosphatase (non-canonical NTP hydrolase)
VHNAIAVGPYAVTVDSGSGPGTVVIEPQQSAGPAELTVDGDRTIRVTCSPGTAGVQLSGAPLQAWLAADHADVCVMGALLDEDHTGFVLVLAGQDTVAADHPVVVCGTTAYLTRVPAHWVSLRRIDFVDRSGRRRDLADLAEAERLEVLIAAGGAATAHGEAAPIADRLLPQVRLAQREALVPLARACPLLAATARGGGDDAIRLLQDRCLALYGRLEPERALSWALEELGELAQAMRRGESTVRIEEELGQVLVWGLCLANITRVDAAHAIAKAYSGERDRQLEKYGTVKPYRRAVASC